MATPGSLEDDARDLRHQAIQNEIAELMLERKAANDCLKNLQRTLSDSVLQEHKCQRRVEKKQMMLDFHKSHAAAVDQRINRLSAELNQQERSAWDAHQAARERRTNNARNRQRRFTDLGPAPFFHTEEAPADADRTQYIPKAKSRGLVQGAPAAPGGAALTPPRVGRSSPAAAAAAKLAFPHAKSVARAPPSKTWSADSQPSLTKAATSFLNHDNPDVSTSSSLTRSRSGPVRSQGLMHLAPPDPHESRPKTGSSDTSGASLFDWFEDRDNSGGQRRPIVTPDGWGSVFGKDDDMAMEPSLLGKNDAKERERMLKMEQELQAQAEHERKLELACHREAEMDRQAEKRRAAVERQLTQKYREDIRDCLLDCVGSAKEAFNALDQNRSGRVSMNEFEGGIRGLNIKWEEITGYTKIREVFKLFDHDKKGYITFSNLFPLDAKREADPERMSTAEFWKYWCKHNQDVSPSVARGAKWELSGPDEKHEILSRGRMAREAADERKQWMRGMIHRLKHRGKSDARCREIVALHLPRGSGPRDLEDVQTFSKNEVAACKKAYADKVQESVRNIEKAAFDMHDQRKQLHNSKHQLGLLVTEEQHHHGRASLMAIGGLGGLFKKDGQVDADA